MSTQPHVGKHAAAPAGHQHTRRTGLHCAAYHMCERLASRPHMLSVSLIFIPCRHSDVSLPPGVPEPYTARLSDGLIYDISLRGACVQF